MFAPNHHLTTGNGFLSSSVPLILVAVMLSHFRARFLCLARSKPRLCSSNRGPGYWSNLPCDWPSTAWAYSVQETENEPWSHAIRSHNCICCKLRRIEQHNNRTAINNKITFRGLLIAEIRSVEFKIWMQNHIHIKVWDILIASCHVSPADYTTGIAVMAWMCIYFSYIMDGVVSIHEHCVYNASKISLRWLI